MRSLGPSGAGLVWLGEAHSLSRKEENQKLSQGSAFPMCPLIPQWSERSSGLGRHAPELLGVCVSERLLPGCSVQFKDGHPTTGATGGSSGGCRAQQPEGSWSSWLQTGREAGDGAAAGRRAQAGEHRQLRGTHVRGADGTLPKRTREARVWGRGPQLGKALADFSEEEPLPLLDDRFSLGEVKLPQAGPCLMCACSSGIAFSEDHLLLSGSPLPSGKSSQSSGKSSNLERHQKGRGEGSWDGKAASAFAGCTPQDGAVAGAPSQPESAEYPHLRNGATPPHLASCLGEVTERESRAPAGRDQRRKTASEPVAPLCTHPGAAPVGSFSRLAFVSTRAREFHGTDAKWLGLGLSHAGAGAGKAKRQASVREPGALEQPEDPSSTPTNFLTLCRASRALEGAGQSRHLTVLSGGHGHREEQAEVGSEPGGWTGGERVLRGLGLGLGGPGSTMRHSCCTRCARVCTLRPPSLCALAPTLHTEEATAVGFSAEVAERNLTYRSQRPSAARRQLKLGDSQELRPPFQWVPWTEASTFLGPQGGSRCLWLPPVDPLPMEDPARGAPARAAANCGFYLRLCPKEERTPVRQKDQNPWGPAKLLSGGLRTRSEGPEEDLCDEHCRT
ncbi:unnamed protein product [Rangifer tarandus platyrhynchus]|uniref:Uncharacterized protein n=1 Tax=Rangifer tarandus platyrhynchus TaxID=3082113 RepID=A0ABN8Y9V1_RANTA|nr:unnamed protein product [Rangifer tarandus platyrhynchus]